MIARSLIAGCGASLPPRVVTNDDLAKTVETNDEWITRRTGIRQRHIADEGMLTSHLATEAAQAALKDAAERSGVAPEDIGFVIVATTTPDNIFPATAVRVQAALGVGGFAFDVQAVCSGFVYALSIADNFIKNGQAKAGLVIGADTLSRIVDWQDRGTCVLFADGAGAVVLSATDKDNPRGILSTHLYSDGSFYDLLYVDGGPSSTESSGKIRMNGREVYRHAVQRMSEVTQEALEKNGMTPAELDWLVPHQANLRIMEACAERLSFPIEKVATAVTHHANTSAATIPLALAEMASDGRLKEGDMVIAPALGGGLTWGAAAFRW
ncbi:beta-ketoacyl-ACP synthase III [Radicibacter daui]|uniref:beta-ketoacyl-ACP synthase III n=1 Tax=Radicibacter daui TaxID=3064829 RepID=UPI0040469112